MSETNEATSSGQGETPSAEPIRNEDGQLTESGREAAIKAAKRAMAATRREARKAEGAEEEDSPKEKPSKPPQDASEAKGEGKTPPESKNASKADSVPAKAKDAEDDKPTVDPEKAKTEAKADEQKKESIQEKLDRVTKEREKAKEIQRQAKEEANYVKIEKAKFEAEQRKYQEEIETFRQTVDLFREDPLAAMQRMGVDPEEHLHRIATNDPQARREREYRESLEGRIQQLESLLHQATEISEKERQAIESKRQEERRRSIVDTFVKTSKSKDRFPVLNDRYGDDERYIVTLGHEAADDLIEKLGYVPSHDEVLEYIEFNLQKRFGNQGSRRQSEEGVATGELPRTVSKDELTGQRSGAPTGSMDPEERKKLAWLAFKQTQRI